MKKYKFTVSSEHINAAAYEPGDPRHYLAEMLAALQKDNLPEKKFASLNKTFHNDIKRATDLYRVEKRARLIKMLNPMYFEDVIGTIFEQELDIIIAKAKAAGNTWVTKDRIMPVVVHLAQGMQAAVFETLNAQFKMSLGTMTINNLYQHALGLSHEYPGNNKIIVDGMKIKWIKEANCFLVANTEDYAALEVQPPKTLDLTLTTETCIDFACLSNNVDGKFMPNSKAITQTVIIEAFKPEFKFTAKPAMHEFTEKSWFRKFIAAVFNFLLRLCCYFSRAAKNTDLDDSISISSVNSLSTASGSISSFSSANTLRFSSVKSYDSFKSDDTVAAESPPRSEENARSSGASIRGC